MSIDLQSVTEVVYKELNGFYIYHGSTLVEKDEKFWDLVKQEAISLVKVIEEVKNDFSLIHKQE